MTEQIDPPAILRAARLLDDDEMVDAYTDCFAATKLLDRAAQHMRDRATTYDKPSGERSMGQTVTAFNAVTGHSITESQGWMLLALLKMVRDQHALEGHQDSCEDAVAYTALYGEARLGGR